MNLKKIKNVKLLLVILAIKDLQKNIIDLTNSKIIY